MAGTDTTYVATTYDSLNRVIEVSNPYHTISDTTYGTTQYQYDLLGRPTQVKHTSDNSTLLYNYSGPSISVQDEGNGTARIQRISQTDGLGRLKTVCEVSNNSLQSFSPVQCGLDYSPTTLGYLTNYGYDPLGNLTSVTAAGTNSRTYNTTGCRD